MNSTLSGYVSEMDYFLQSFDNQHPTLSLSQKKEVEKYNRIYFLRDTVKRSEENQIPWDHF